MLFCSDFGCNSSSFTQDDAPPNRSLILSLTLTPRNTLSLRSGTLMILAWGFFIPIGTLLAVYRRYIGKNGKIMKKEPSFYPWHRNLQTIGFLLAMIGFGMGAAGSKKIYNTGRAFDDDLLNYRSPKIPWNRHVKWGVSVLIIAGTQVLLGIIAHVLKDRHAAKPDAGPWKRPLVPSWLHVVMGLCNVLAAYITIYQGLQIYDLIFYDLQKSPGIKAGYALVSISGFLFLSFYMYEKVQLMFCGAGAPPPVVADDKEVDPAEQPMEPSTDAEASVKQEEPLASGDFLASDEGAT